MSYSRRGNTAQTTPSGNLNKINTMFKINLQRNVMIFQSINSANLKI